MHNNFGVKPETKLCQSLNCSHIEFKHYERNRSSFRAIYTIGATQRDAWREHFATRCRDPNRATVSHVWVPGSHAAIVIRSPTGWHGRALTRPQCKGPAGTALVVGLAVSKSAGVESRRVAHPCLVHFAMSWDYCWFNNAVAYRVGMRPDGERASRRIAITAKLCLTIRN